MRSLVRNALAFVYPQVKSSLHFEAGNFSVTCRLILMETNHEESNFAYPRQPAIGFG
jgi:hypothetical protein